MIFSIGDLITFVVVLLILAVYRALDRNNRSLEKLKRFSDKITENLSAHVQQKSAEVKDLSLELQANLKMGREILARARGVEELLQGRARDVEEIQNRFAEYDKSLAELTAMSARVDKNLARIRDESSFLDTVGRRIGESAQRLELVEKRIPEIEQRFAAQAREELETARTAALASARETASALSAQVLESEKKVKDFSSYIARLETRAEQAEKERLQERGRALDAFESDLRGKMSLAVQRAETLEDEVFARLSARLQEDEAAISRSIQTIEMRLSDYQGDVDYRVKALEESNKDVDALRASLSQTLEKMAAGVRSEMKAMAAELTAGWNAEIAGASAARDKVRAGMDELESGLVSLKTRAYQDVERKLSVFEDEFFVDLRTRSTAMQEKLQAWQSEMETRTAVFEADVKERIAAADGSVQTLREAVRAEMEKVKKDASLSLEKDLAGVRDAMEAGTRKMHREIEAGLDELSSGLDAGRKEIAELFEASRAEVAAWGEKARQQLAETELGIAEKITSLSGEASSSIGAVRDGFAAQREELRNQMREVQADVEGRIKEHQQQIVEIDKRVKNFLSQTRLFERADSMKAALEGTIDEMKKEMGKLNADRAEIAEIEVQLSRTKKLADDVSVKLTRFLSEKRRIEDMDAEFKKIITLSRDVDLKIDTLSSSNDALQQIQAKIRQFEDMGKAVEGGFERLEKKREILSITSESVDKNFQRLEGIEKALQEADRAADDLSGKVQSLRSEYDMLAGNKKDADSAMETVGRLTGIMAELESRLEKAQNAREWMARTETRFEEIGRQAQEQVRLLESIIKAETKKDKPDRGAPPLDKRETVVKLSHQGWSVQEISRVTQLSRGEVELILELAPKV